jgi:hypothetical protein
LLIAVSINNQKSSINNKNAHRVRQALASQEQMLRYQVISLKREQPTFPEGWTGRA